MISNEGPLFFWFFAALFVLRAVAATFVYAWLLSEAPECPSCGDETLRLEHRGIARLFPRLRPSWCPACGWEGLLQPARRRSQRFASASSGVSAAKTHDLVAPRSRE